MILTTTVPLLAQERSVLPGPTIPDGFGVNIHFTQAEPGELEMLAKSGNRFVRMDLAWQGVEREKGKYDFSRYDRLVEDMGRLNIRILFILDYAHRFYDEGLPPHTEEGRLAFARFAAAAAERYAGKGIIWEIWNEPNIKQFWKPQPNVVDYCKLAHATIDAIRKVDRQAFIVGPASSTFPWEFFEVMGEQGVLQKLNAVSVHPYRQTMPETAEQDYARLRLLLHKYVPNRRLRILSGEWGYSTAWRGMTEEKQAQYIVRQRLMNLACDVPLSIWYDWRDDGLDPKEPEHHFGTVYRDFKPKPSYVAAQILSEKLNGFEYVRRVATRDDRDWVLIFRKGGQTMLAYWTTAEPHRTQPPEPELELTNTPAIESFHAGSEVSCWRPAAGTMVLRAGEDTAIVLEATNPFLAELKAKVAVIVGGEQVGGADVLWPSGTPVRQRIPFKLVRRDAAMMDATITVDGPRSLSSLPARMKLLVTNHLTVHALPPIGKTATLILHNPGGQPIEATIRLTAPHVVASEGLYIPSGQVRATATFELPEPVAEGAPFSVKARSRDERTIFEVTTGGWGRTATLEERADWQAVLEGNDAVAANAHWFFHDFDLSPPQPGLTRQIELIYQFAEGWRFAMLQPPKDEREIPGKPKVLGMWVHGDGSRNMLRCRFVDATGQTFQPDYGLIDWTGWKWITIPLDGVNAGHWGGADDGTIDYPIRWDSIALVDNMNVKLDHPLSLRFAGFAVGYE